MRHTPRRRLLLGLPVLAFASSLLADAARSPYRHAPAASVASRPAVAGQQWLELDVAALAALRSAGPGSVEIADFPIAPGATGRLVLRRFEVAAPGAHIRVTGKDGDTFLPLPEIAHFSGRVEGITDSIVYVAAQPDQIVAWIRSGEGVSYVGPDEARTGFVVRDSKSSANDAYTATPWRCDSENLPTTPVLGAAAATPPPKAGQAPDITGFQKNGVIVETDQEFLAKFSGDQVAMAAYCLTIFAQFNLIYERDLQLHLTVSEVHAWTTTDPFVGPLPIDQLNQLGDWYHANRPIATFPRATVFLMSGVTVAGGVAWQPGLCVDDIFQNNHWVGGYGITQLYGMYPATLWDLFSTAHEIGHNAGSAHTHCYVPAIDHCWNQDAGCYNGPVENPGAGGGTLMSYCYLLGPGFYDYITFAFHQRCITEQMLPFIQSQTCFTAVATFPDVPTTSPFFHYVQTIYQLGITGGCAGGNYCPTSPVFRQQMAVFLLKAKFGSAHVPPACTGTVFTDVPCAGGPFDPWIEELFSLGIAGGCGNGMFCPTSTVTRKQMAPFLLKTLYGSAHVPPTPTGVFQDVPLPANPFAPFIEELYSLGITGGCATAPLRYCPDNPNTRAQMAVFLVKTFDLVW